MHVSVPRKLPFSLSGNYRILEYYITIPFELHVCVAFVNNAETSTVLYLGKATNRAFCILHKPWGASFESAGILRNASN